MEISYQLLQANSALISLDGRLDANTSPEVRAVLHELIDQGYYRFIIDLTAVPFIDSSGLAALVSGLRVARENGGTLVLCGVQAQAKAVFRLTMLDRVFLIYPDLDAAKQNLS